MYVLIDIGGTKTRIATCNDLSADVADSVKISTPDKPGAAVSAIVDTLNSQTEGNQVTAVCAGIAGIITDGAVHRSPNLRAWEGVNLQRELTEALPVTDVHIINDTALGALGEAHAGAGSDTGITGYLTVGTGVGGCRIVEGEIDQAAYGFEPGHQIMQMDDFLDLGDQLPPEGRIPGHLEYYLSGANFTRKTGQKPPEIKDERLWEQFQDRLASALMNVAVMWGTDVIVVGGSMIFRNEFLSFAYLQKALEQKLTIYPTVPTIQRAVLQDDAGLVGAQVYLRQKQD